jgi:RNA polymerase sigma-70 factor (ECF subfamily)
MATVSTPPIEEYEAYRPDLLRLAGKLLNDEDLAEEVVNDAIMSVWRTQNSPKAGDSTLRTKLYQATRHRARDAAKARLTAKRKGILVPLELALEVPVEDSSREQDRIDNAIDRLAAKDQVIVRAYFWDEDTLAVIGARLGVSRQRVHQRLRGILQQLKALLK